MQLPDNAVEELPKVPLGRRGSTHFASTACETTSAFARNRHALFPVIAIVGFKRFVEKNPGMILG
jgi:hypothetical protein